MNGERGSREETTNYLIKVLIAFFDMSTITTDKGKFVTNFEFQTAADFSFDVSIGLLIPSFSNSCKLIDTNTYIPSCLSKFIFMMGKRILNKSFQYFVFSFIRSVTILPQIRMNKQIQWNKKFKSSQ